MEVVASDMGGQMQDYDKLLKRVAAEMKLMAAEKAEVDAKLGEIKQIEDKNAKTAATADANAKKGSADAAATERDNLTRIAGLLDQMAPDAAAAILQQWADSGKTDDAVRVIALMKPAKATKVLTSFTDPTVPPLLFDRMKALKLTPPAGGQ
jgi:alanyl-tRNA synthetase